MQALRVYSADVPNIKLDLDTEVLFSHCKSCGSLTYIWPCVLTEEYHLRVDILFSQHYAHQNAQTHNSEQQRSVTTGHIRQQATLSVIFWLSGLPQLMNSPRCFYAFHKVSEFRDKRDQPRLLLQYFPSVSSSMQVMLFPTSISAFTSDNWSSFSLNILSRKHCAFLVI